MDLILASASPRRSQLLSMIGLDFRVIPADIDEGNDISNPADAAVDTAFRKASRVAEDNKASIIIAADTIVASNSGAVFGKPSSESQAVEMLRSLSDSPHEVYTGVCVMQNNRHIKKAVRTTVYFRKLTDKEIYDYVKTGEPMDKAGAYGIQGRGALFVEKIDGDFYNVVGLPVAPLMQMIEDLKKRVL